MIRATAIMLRWHCKQLHLNVMYAHISYPHNSSVKHTLIWCVAVDVWTCWQYCPIVIVNCNRYVVVKWLPWQRVSADSRQTKTLMLASIAWWQNGFGSTVPPYLYCQSRSHISYECHLTRSVNKVMRLIQYNAVLTFKLQIVFVPFKIVSLGGYTPPESLFPLFITTLVVANRNRF